MSMSDLRVGRLAFWFIGNEIAIYFEARRYDVIALRRREYIDEFEKIAINFAYEKAKWHAALYDYLRFMKARNWPCRNRSPNLR